MKALTVWQPWAWAIAAGLKQVENRSWRPSYKQLNPGDDLVIHAGAHQPTRDELEAVRFAAGASDKHWQVPKWPAPEYRLSCVVAVVRFEGIVERRDELPPEQRPWFVGRFGWRFGHVRQLQYGRSPVVRGEQGIWHLLGDAERFVSTSLLQPEGDAWRKTA